MRDTVERLNQRFTAAKRVKDQWRDLESDAYEYTLPQRNLYYNDGDGQNAGSTQGQKKVSRVFDSTAVASLIKFANRIQMSLMPPFKRWIKFVAGPLVPDDVKDEVNAVLEVVTERFFALLQSSNFDNQNNEVLLDLGIGTGAMLTLEGDLNKPFMFNAVPSSQILLEDGPWGGVRGIFRCIKMKAVNIEGQWPDAKMPDGLKEKIEDDPSYEVEVREMTYFSDKENVWYYDVIYNRDTTSSKDGERVVEREYKTCPWQTPRWIKVAGETYGRGPVIQALPDIKTLNKIVEFVLKNAALHIAGVYTGVPGNNFNPNNVAITPGTVIPVDRNAGSRGPSLQPLERTGSFDLAAIEVERLTDHIKQMLFDKSLPPETGGVRSATEIIERMKELAQDIGAPFGRLYTEYIVPMVQRCLEIMEKRGFIPKVKIDGLAVKAVILSPLAVEQNLNDVQTVVRWLSVLGQLGPEVMHLSAKTEDAGDWIGEKMGVPSKLRRTDKEREQMMQQAAQLAANNGAGNVIPIGNGQGGIGMGGGKQLPIAA